MDDPENPEPIIETPNLSIRHKKKKKKLGWPKGKSRKPQVEALKEIEKRIELSAFLSNEEKAEARERAREHVTKKRKEKAIDDYFNAAVKAEEQALNPKERLEDFIVDLPEYTYHITINGTMYYHGVQYRLPFSQCRSMADIQARAWEHQREIDGRRRMGDQSRKHEHLVISPTRPGRVNTSGSMRI